MKLLMLIRHLLAILILPFSVTVILPSYLLRRYGGPQLAPGVLPIAGALMMLVGLFFFGWTLRLFIVRGRGTLAPWDPPKHLVVEGPYRHVRNPMIAGVTLIVFGESMLLRSLPIAGWGAAFVLLNLIYIPLTEEPMLEARFGEEYREYRRHVRGLVPQLRGWPPAL